MTGRGELSRATSPRREQKEKGGDRGFSVPAASAMIFPDRRRGRALIRASRCGGKKRILAGRLRPNTPAESYTGGGCAATINVCAKIKRFPTIRPEKMKGGRKTGKYRRQGSVDTTESHWMGGEWEVY